MRRPTPGQARRAAAALPPGAVGGPLPLRSERGAVRATLLTRPTTRSHSAVESGRVALRPDLVGELAEETTPAGRRGVEDGLVQLLPNSGSARTARGQAAAPGRRGGARPAVGAGQRRGVTGPQHLPGGGEPRRGTTARSRSPGPRAPAAPEPRLGRAAGELVDHGQHAVDADPCGGGRRRAARRSGSGPAVSGSTGSISWRSRARSADAAGAALGVAPPVPEPDGGTRRRGPGRGRPAAAACGGRRPDRGRGGGRRRRR